jgi:hypothetical protein
MSRKSPADGGSQERMMKIRFAEIYRINSEISKTGDEYQRLIMKTSFAEIYPEKSLLSTSFCDRLELSQKRRSSILARTNRPPVVLRKIRRICSFSCKVLN